MVEGGVGTTKQMLIPSEEGPNYAMRCERSGALL